VAPLRSRGVEANGPAKSIGGAPRPDRGHSLTKITGKFVTRSEVLKPNQKTQSENAREAFGVSQVDLHRLECRISRYHRLLYSLAYRLLGNHRDAEDAVESCVLSVRRNVRTFEHEGSFRAWLARVLIDKALAIFDKNRAKSTTASSAVLKSLNGSFPNTGEEYILARGL
jgi:hypothetical protein